ncbi:hypothetical protein [Nioella sp. MMSF_3534]|uniref:hypothetical protein n=1 Tax=Nioella sp. MMSF_3534 TaxID=3046720 RepID=UPI00273D4EA1|nr:hypothetical protein [Nioella sp. MMSF_3534]
MTQDPRTLVVEFETSSVFGALLHDAAANDSTHRAELQILVKTQKASIRDIAAAVLASMGLAEAGPSLSTTSGVLAAVLFAASGVVDIRVLKGWAVDDFIDQLDYDNEIEQFYICKTDLYAYLENSDLTPEFFEWLIEAGVLVDDAGRLRCNKLFKKGNIINII